MPGEKKRIFCSRNYCIYRWLSACPELAKDVEGSQGFSLFSNKA